jgi:prophage antirepressor-like protein
MNDLQNFNFSGQDVRVITINDEPWFVGKDVAEILGYDQTSNMIKRLDSEDFMSSKMDGMNMKSTLINESGLYTAILGSKKSEAKHFKRWVTSEVLPTIRKNGMYVVDNLLANPDIAIQVFTKLKDEREKRLIAEQRVNELQPKASYYDYVLQTKNLVSVSVIAKQYGKSAIWLNRLLHEYGIIFKQGKVWLVYQNYADKGYTKTNFAPDDIAQLHPHTKWTQKGMLFIYDLLKSKGILPMIERGDAYD